MSYWLGIDVGTTYTAAALCRTDSDQRPPPEVITLGSRAVAVSSVVYLGENGQVVVGEAAERRAVTHPERVIREFKRRIGDDVPMIIDGVPHSAPQITAMLIRWVADRVTEREGAAAAGIVITHPAGWGTYKIQVVADALRAAGLAEAMFRTEPEAAAASYASQQRVEPGSTIAVYDLGGGTFDAAVIRKSGTMTFSVLGVPQGIEQLGGADFDDAVFGHVLAAVPALRELDPEDPATLAATAALRRQCTEAKEALSVDTEVTIPVLAPGVQSQVRLVRAELEDMIRPQLAETVEALHQALQSAGVGPEDLDAVLLVGGSSRIPLVTQLVSTQLGRPVALDADPSTAIALGAALCARPHAELEALATVVPVTVEAEPVTSAQTPPRPSLSAVPLEIAPVPSRWRSSSPRVNRGAAAALLALVLAGGGMSVLLLNARSAPLPPANADIPATPTPTPTPTPALATTNGDKPSSGSGAATGAARPPHAAALSRAAAPAATARAAVVPAPQTTSASTESAPPSRSTAPSASPTSPSTTTATSTSSTSPEPSPSPTSKSTPSPSPTP